MLLFITSFWHSIICFCTRFNTSHVTLYRYWERKDTRLKTVSIHHMLLFISDRAEHERSQGSFNTSHVTLYRRTAGSSVRGSSSFNTSHVTLYPRGQQDSERLRSFNTSHVTLYLDEISKVSATSEFQYITCYSLSLVL